jgi:hypothetical protein
MASLMRRPLFSAAGAKSLWNAALRINRRRRR